MENLEHLELLCLDDIDAIVGKRHWEEAIMHCFNQMQQQQHRLIVSANATPQALAFTLPDLRSRMASCMIYKVNEMSNQQKLEALQFRANALGLTLTNKTALFLLNHCARDTHSLFNTLRQLDRAALQAKSKITVPFIKRTLGL
jgi:DnaA family protein